MFAHLRSKQAKQDNQANQSKQDRLLHLATTMRDSVRRHMHPLIQIDQHNHPEFAAPLAEIYMREFACMLQTLKQVNWIASKYHEHAFDNTDAYIEGQRPLQLSPHEMTAEQRHASQILLGVGNNYSEINVALKTLDCNISMKDVMECEGAMIEILAQEFRNDSRLPEDAFDLPEDAFDRLHHITQNVWSLVNMLAFSNLFRFADPGQPILIANPDDSIFIPHIPTATNATNATNAEEDIQIPTKTRHECNGHVCNGHVCNEAEMNRKQQEQELFTRAAKLLADDKITPEQACSFIETLRDAGIITDDILDPEPEQEQQKGFNEIAGLFADWKITTEEACDLFAEWIREYSK